LTENSNGSGDTVRYTSRFFLADGNVKIFTFFTWEQNENQYNYRAIPEIGMADLLAVSVKIIKMYRIFCQIAQ